MGGAKAMTRESIIVDDISLPNPQTHQTITECHSEIPSKPVSVSTVPPLLPMEKGR